MALINLLPHRERTRQRRQKAFQRLMLAAVSLSLLAAGWSAWHLQALLEQQQARNASLHDQIAKLAPSIQEVQVLEDAIATLEERQRAVEALQARRNLPVQLLNALALGLPDGVYLTRIQQSGLHVDVQGVAESNQRVSEALSNLAQAQGIGEADLKESAASAEPLSAHDIRKVVRFHLSFPLLLPPGSTQEAD